MGRNELFIRVPNLMYFGGDVVYGVVELRVESELKSRGVRVLFSGKEQVNWATGGDNSVSFSATEFFMFQRWDLAGVPSRERNYAPFDVVKPGIYRWPISFQLPEFALPTWHFKSSTNIMYTCDAYVDTPPPLNLKSRAEIVVGGNYIPLPRFLTPLPFSAENQKSFLFAFGELHMTVSAANTHVIPGDSFAFHVSVDNKSGKNVDEIKVALFERHKFHVGQDSTSGRKKIGDCQEMLVNVPKKSGRDFDFSFLIPSNTFPSLNRSIGGTRNISLNYELEVRLDVALAVDLTVKIPITVMRLDPKTVSQAVAFYPPPSYFALHCPNHPNKFAHNAPPALLYPQIDGYKYPAAEVTPVQIGLGTANIDVDEQSVLGNSNAAPSTFHKLSIMQEIYGKKV